MVGTIRACQLLQLISRRGYTPESIRTFCDKIGVQKRENLIDLSLLEFCVREDLNKNATRRMAVLDPVKLIITNYPDGKEEVATAKIILKQRMAEAAGNSF